MAYKDLDEITVCSETEEQVANSVKHSKLAGTRTSHIITLHDKTLNDDVSVIEAERSETTSAAMMLFNNGYDVMMDNSRMMDNTLQVIIQPSTVKHLIYYYFSSTFETSVFGCCKATIINEVLGTQFYLYYLMVIHKQWKLRKILPMYRYC